MDSLAWHRREHNDDIRCTSRGNRIHHKRDDLRDRAAARGVSFAHSLMAVADPPKGHQKGLKERLAPRNMGLVVMLACELCGQPAARKNPTLCAECYYSYWYWQRAKPVAENETILEAH